MNIAQYIDATFLTPPASFPDGEDAYKSKIKELCLQAQQYGCYLVMVRPEFVSFAKEFLQDLGSTVKVGTVIDFPEGNSGPMQKMNDAKEAIANGADDLDFVVNYEAYKNGGRDTIYQEVMCCTGICLMNGRTPKWIVETAALSDEQIAGIARELATMCREYFADQLDKIYLKTSTGFYESGTGKPSGATPKAVQLLVENSGGLQVKASGGIRTKEEAEEYIRLGATRIGASAVTALCE